MSRHMLNVIYAVCWVCLAEVWEKEFDPIMVILRTVYRRDVQSAMDRYSALWVTLSSLCIYLDYARFFFFFIIITWWLCFLDVFTFCSIKINPLKNVRALCLSTFFFLPLKRCACERQCLIQVPPIRARAKAINRSSLKSNRPGWLLLY